MVDCRMVACCRYSRRNGKNYDKNTGKNLPQTGSARGWNMGIAGIPWWTTDDRSFTGGDPEDAAFRQLLVRWFEWGTSVR